MKKIHRAWAVCLGCTLALLVCGGLCINAFSVTQPYILAQNGFTNTQTSMITTACSVTFLLCMFVVNAYYEKLGYRVGLTLAVLLGVGSFVLFAEARTLPGYYLAGMLAGVSYGLGAMLPASILMLRWFSSRRGTAIGICAAGTGISAVVFSPILSALIERFSLRVCFYFEALVSLLAAIAVFLLIRERPEACGLAPYGTQEAASSSEKQKPFIRPGRFRWAMLYLGVVLIGSIASPGFAHMMILFTSSGFSGAQAAFAVSVFGLALTVGKCFYGAACDRLGTEKSNWLFGAFLVAGLICCTLAGLRSVALMLLAAVLFGIGIPLSTVGLSVWAADFCPESQRARCIQRFQLCYAVGGLAFSFMPGAIADLTGSYAPAYIVFTLFAIFTLAVVQSTYRLGRRSAV